MRIFRIGIGKVRYLKKIAKLEKEAKDLLWSEEIRTFAGKTKWLSLRARITYMEDAVKRKYELLEFEGRVKICKR